MKDVKDYYRDLHKIPEVSCMEYKTSEYLINELKRIGYEPQRIGQTGLYTDLISDKNSSYIILRADMDALSITENTDLEWKSQNKGVMHACGHDGHMAMLLSAAEKLYGKKLFHNIRFVFQHAEENTMGAMEMIERGVIPENTAAAFGLHNWPGVEENLISTKIGALMASSDTYRVIVNGKSAHCGQQHLGSNALKTVVDIAHKLSELQDMAEDKRTILFCGSINSGKSHNVVPNYGELYGTLRSFSKSDRVLLKTKLEEISKEIARKYGTEAELIWESGCPAIDNSASLIEKLKEIEPNLKTDEAPTLAAEDFACFQEKVKGVMLWLGTGNTPPLHNDKYYFPEKVLEKGVSLWGKIAEHNFNNN